MSVQSKIKNTQGNGKKVSAEKSLERLQSEEIVQAEI